MDKRIGASDAGALTPDAADERHWVETYADHVRRRFNSRALVSVRIAGEAPVVLSYVYAMEGGGLVLCLPSGEAEDDEGHEEETAPLHHGGERGTGKSELWIASPESAVFEVQRVEDGVLCTGFGYLGLSRTPHVIVPRGTEPPPVRDHHKVANF